MRCHTDGLVFAEDYWGSVSHTSYSAYATTLPFGAIGQEITGAGAAFGGALLAARYGASIATNPSQDQAATAQLHPRWVRVEAGEEAVFQFYPAVSEAEWGNARASVQGAAFEPELRFNRTASAGQVVLRVPAAAAAGPAEAVVWLEGAAGGPRPYRQVVEILPARRRAQ